MTACVAILLGRTLWTREGGKWRPAAPQSAGGQTADTLSLLGESVLGSPAGRAAVVYEPESLSHQGVEAPRASRAVFASLARIRGEYPAVASENIGWGIDPPEPGPGGNFTTQIHSEFAPALVDVHAACEAGGRRLAAAWPAYTVAAQCLRARAGTRAGYVLIIAEGYVALAACGPKRAYRAWTGPMSEKDWRALGTLIGEGDGRASAGLAHGVQGRRGVLVVSAGEQRGDCPLWTELDAAGRVEAVLDLEGFACAAARIPVGHPANLVASFPRRLDLDRGLLACAACLFAATAAVCALAVAGARKGEAQVQARLASVARLGERLAALKANRVEMARLRNEGPEHPAPGLPGAYAALESLSSALPDSLTLTALSIRQTGDFEIRAIVTGPGFEQDAARLALSRCGFKAGGGDGWSYDPAGGVLRVRGRLEEAVP